MKYLSLFSGIGGFELGIQNSDVEMECIGFSEIDKNAKSIYRRRFPNHRDLGDATKIRPGELPDFDLLVAGFPCQSFSIAGTRGGLNDTRGTLFFEIARICEEKKPQYLLLENVLGLLSDDGGRTFKTFLGILSKMGYFIQWEVCNSKNHGVPQNRERLFIKGYLGGRGRPEVLDIGGGQDRDSGEGREEAPGIDVIVPGKQATRIMSLDGASMTLCGNAGGLGGKTGLYAFPRDDGDFDVRRLSPVEAERLQGFPDDWTRLGVDGEEISDTQRFRCVGNAVTTHVITHLINRMFSPV